MHAKRRIGASDPESGHQKPIDPRWEILEYLRAHPGAADSLDGIVIWWLSRQRYETASEAIQEALNDLEAQGVIEAVTLGDGRRLYRLSAQSGPSQ